MADVELDALFALAEAGPLLDKVSAAVSPTLAQRLAKLQEDVGLEIDHEMTGAPLTGPGDGPDTARLRAAYEPVTAQRFGLLGECLAVLPDGQIKTALADVIKVVAPQAESSAMKIDRDITVGKALTLNPKN